METILQYSHTSDNPFDFNDKNAKAGFHRLGAENSFKNAPSGVNPLYSNVLVVRNNAWDTLSMTIYLYTKGINSSVIYKTGNTTEWANLSWNVFATKSDLTAYLSKGMVAQISSAESITTTGLYHGKFIPNTGWEIAFAVIQNDGAGCFWAIDTVQGKFYIGSKKISGASWITKEIS